LTLSARQIISIARGILSSADVLMLHKPVAFLTPTEADVVLGVLGQYASSGGLWGMLDPKHAHQGSSAVHYLTGNGVRTVILTMPHHARKVVPEVVTKVVNCELAHDTLDGGIGRAPSVENLGSEEFRETEVSSRLNSDLVWVHKKSAENGARESGLGSPPRSPSRRIGEGGAEGAMRPHKPRSPEESPNKKISADEALRKLAADASVHRLRS
jgi:hypothetical protein